MCPVCCVKDVPGLNPTNAKPGGLGYAFVFEICCYQSDATIFICSGESEDAGVGGRSRARTADLLLVRHFPVLAKMSLFQLLMLQVVVAIVDGPS